MTSIANFDLLKEIGVGAFGRVYRARRKRLSGQSVRSGTQDGQHDADIAIKIIDKRKMKAAGLLARVANEVEVHSQLDHPGIVRLYDFFEDKANVYITMELCHRG